MAGVRLTMNASQQQYFSLAGIAVCTLAAVWIGYESLHPSVPLPQLDHVADVAAHHAPPARVISPSRAPRPMPTERVDVPFTAEVRAGDLAIARVSAQPAGNFVVFTLDYTSGRERRLQFFDPPEGKVVSITKPSLVVGQHSLTFQVPAASVRIVPEIMIEFRADGENERNAIRLRVDAPGVRSIFGDRLAIPRPTV